jgi:hypothetical protein
MSGAGSGVLGVKPATEMPPIIVRFAEGLPEPRNQLVAIPDEDG